MSNVYTIIQLFITCFMILTHNNDVKILTHMQDRNKYYV